MKFKGNRFILLELHQTIFSQSFPPRIENANS